MLGLAGVLRPRAADRTATVFAAQHGVVAGARAAEFTSGLHQDFDGDPRKCEAEKANGQDDFRPSHGAKIHGDSWRLPLQFAHIKLYYYIYVIRFCHAVTSCILGVGLVGVCIGFCPRASRRGGLWLPRGVFSGHSVRVRQQRRRCGNAALDVRILVRVDGTGLCQSG